MHLGHYGLTILPFPGYCKSLRQKTHNFFGVQKFIQKPISGTMWFDPYSPFKDLT